MSIKTKNTKIKNLTKKDLACWIAYFNSKGVKFEIV